MEDLFKDLESRGLIEWRDVSQPEDDILKTYILKIRGCEYTMIVGTVGIVNFCAGDVVINGARSAAVENPDDVFTPDWLYKNYFVLRGENKKVVAYIPLEEVKKTE